MPANQQARVAKLADARDLKSRVSKETYRFNSDPGHHLKPKLFGSQAVAKISSARPGDARVGSAPNLSSGKLPEQLVASGHV